MNDSRTPPQEKAKELARSLRAEHADYAYLKAVFRGLREELNIAVPRPSRRLPDVPTEAELRRYYEVVWQSQNMGTWC